MKDLVRFFGRENPTTVNFFSNANVKQGKAGPATFRLGGGGTLVT